MSDLLVSVYLAVGALAILIYFARTPGQIHDPHEPKLVHAYIPVPFIGHLVGLYWYRTGYYTKLSAWCNLPIFSILLPGRKVYIVSSPKFMHSLHRNPKAVSFWYIEALFTAKLGNMSRSAEMDLVENLEPDSKEESIVFVEGLKLVRQVMSPQGSMDAMSRVAAAVTKRQIDQLDEQTPCRVDLWEWVQHEITIATTECVYGPQNPYRDPKVEAGFWDFADDTIGILVNSVFPNVFSSKGIRGRETVVRAMMHYFGSEYYLQGSDFVKTRRKTVHYEDLIGDIARSETVNGIAILGNSVPTAFWTIFHIYSDWGVLQTVRDQVSQITSLSPDGRTKFINISKLRDAPIIFSVLQEALRHRATGTGPRLVMEDISVGDEGYLLKRGSLVIIANKALHFDKEEWGDDVAAFRADRFCKKTPSRAFRGFGGGVNLCPGRGFAMVEVGALIAMLAMRYDIEPVVAGQGWREPGQKMTNMSLQIAPPGAKVVVDFVPRPGAMDFTWEFSL